jgi:Tfp pilus assembly protein PilO
MSDNNQNNQQKHECKCEGGKELKALKKQYAELLEKFEQLERQVTTLRKAVRK